MFLPFTNPLRNCTLSCGKSCAVSVSLYLTVINSFPCPYNCLPWVCSSFRKGTYLTAGTVNMQYPWPHVGVYAVRIKYLHFFGWDIEHRFYHHVALYSEIIKVSVLVMFLTDSHIQIWYKGTSYRTQQHFHSLFLATTYHVHILPWLPSLVLVSVPVFKAWGFAVIGSDHVKP